MTRTEQDRLLNDLLAGEDLEAVRKATLECGLTALRRRRQFRQMVRTCTLFCLPLLVTLVLLLFNHRALERRTTSARAQAVPAVASSPSNGGVKIISDEELFALFPNRPMVLVGEPGHQQLVFLDQPEQSGRR